MYDEKLIEGEIRKENDFELKLNYCQIVIVLVLVFISNHNVS